MANRSRLRRGSLGFHNAVEEALAEERANALGRSGRRLEEALDDHRVLQEVGHATPAQLEAALRAIGEAAWALIVHREAVGFRTDNLGWIRRHYDIPGAALRFL